MRRRPRALSHCWRPGVPEVTGHTSPQGFSWRGGTSSRRTSSQQREEFLAVPGVKVRALKTEGTCYPLTGGSTDSFHCCQPGETSQMGQTSLLHRGSGYCQPLYEGRATRQDREQTEGGLRRALAQSRGEPLRPTIFQPCEAWAGLVGYVPTSLPAPEAQ